MLILIILNVIIGYISAIKKKNNYFIILLMFFLFIGNYYNSDYNNYLRFFERISQGLMEKEFLYTEIIKIFNYLGMDYRKMLIFYGVIIFYFIIKIVKRYSVNQSFVYLLYFIYPFIYDTIQIRNFIVMVILSFSIRYIIEKKLCKYIFCIFIASGFHKVAYIYILFYLVNYLNKKKILLIGIVVNIIGIIIYLTNLLPILLKGKMQEVNINFYFIDNNARYGWIIYIFFQILILILIEKNIKLNKNRRDFNEIVLKINYLCLIFIPLYYYNSTLDRIYRNILLINYIVFSNLCKKNIKLMNFFILLVVLLYISFNFRYFGNEHILNLINYNWVIDEIKNVLYK